MAIQSYQDLIAWQKAMDLVEAVYRASRRFPSDERYELTSQLRKAVVSIPSNIAEGQDRSSRKEYIYHLGVASGSRAETETQLMIARRLGYVDESAIASLLDQCREVGRLINGLANALRRSADRPNQSRRRQDA